MNKKTAAGIIAVSLLLTGAMGCTAGNKAATTGTAEPKAKAIQEGAQGSPHGNNSMSGEARQGTGLNPHQPAVQAPAKIEIATDTPEKTVASYAGLLSAGQYEEAARLQTETSRKKFNGAVLQAAKEDPHGNLPVFFKAYPAVIDQDVAAVAIINLNPIGMGEPAPMIDITVVKQNPKTKKWEIVNDIAEVLGKDQKAGYIQLLQNLIKLEESLQKTDFVKDGLSQSQAGQVAAQLPPMLDFHRQQLAELQKQKGKAKS